MEHPIGTLMQTAMASIKDMVDVNTVIGDPVVASSGATIIPISKVSFGFATGGADFGGHEKETEKANTTVTDRKSNFGGGAGAGVNITPIAFMVIPPDGNVRMMTIGEPASSTLDRVVDIVPDLLQRVQDFITQLKEKKEPTDA